jgi:3D (Asp-Asp-Asp) domain-containing protein
LIFSAQRNRGSNPLLRLYLQSPRVEGRDRQFRLARPLLKGWLQNWDRRTRLDEVTHFLGKCASRASRLFCNFLRKNVHSNPGLKADASPGAALEKADAASIAVAAETYSATAYSLRGKTASGRFVTRGLIAADPRILPLGTRVRLDAGPWSGEYIVADTGGAIKGRKIDIWTPSSREALQFGRRSVKLTVLFYPPKPAKSIAARARVVKTTTTPATVDPAGKQEK